MLRNLMEILEGNSELRRGILKGNFGLEKENLRVDRHGKLALTSHPKTLGDKTIHPYITTDFSESQIEMITPPFKSIDETYYFLENIHDIVSSNIGDELLWPQSLPPALPSEDMIPIAEFDDSEKGRDASQYREMLAKKYGKEKQLISGIHYNFSFEDELLLEIKEAVGDTRTFREFKDDAYLKVARNLLRYNWFLVYLFGASIGGHGSFAESCCLNERVKVGDDSYYFPHATSFRNGPCGYKNLKEYMVSYKNLDTYIKDVRELIESKEISGAREYYSSIRLKSLGKGDLLKQLEERGIEYLELRFLDLNPYKKIGISRETMYFIHLFLIHCLVSEDREYDIKSKTEYDANTVTTSFQGRNEDVKLKDEGVEVGVEAWKEKLLDNMSKTLELLAPKNKMYKESLEKIGKRAMEKPLSRKLADSFDEEGFLKFHLNRALKYLEDTKAKEYNLKSYEDLELSTQILIKEAILKGVEVDIIDRKENFITLKKGDKSEYVKQATKTSLDSYSTMLVMENKLVTKNVLDSKGVRTPKGRSYTNIDEAMDDYSYFRNGGIVVKPNNTNFGIGITIFKDGASKEDYNKALEIAFSNDETILVEEFIKGKEYRFFVIGDEVVGILHRVPANVLGDGKSSIMELVIEKNKDPLRGKGYKTPLEKIRLEVAEEMFLRAQGLDFDSIPKDGETVYLRENSNISTGGDSIDFTDDIHMEYKKIAVEASKAVDAKICGVDVMLEDIGNFHEDKYAIIELNFNPAIHIHCYPYKGSNRRVGKKVLDALGY